MLGSRHLAIALAALPLAAAAPALAAALAPPVIHETFTVLPCPKHPQTTLQLEGCAEHRILATDRQIDAVAALVFKRLHDDAARRRFVAAQEAWLTFRRADCASQADVNEGGTLSVLDDATCSADRNVERLSELRSFAKALAAGT